MAERTWWETIEAKGGQALDQLKHIVDEGNIRRVRVRQKTRVVAEFPLTVGVVGAVFAPPLAAVGVLVALLTDCAIEVERDAPVEKPVEKPVTEPEPASTQTT